MMNAVANNIELSLYNIDTAMSVLEAALERAESVDTVRPENGTEAMFVQEIQYIRKLVTAVSMLMRQPVELLEDIKGTAWQLAREAKEGGDA